MSHCPDDNLLIEVLQGTISSSDLQELEPHLSDCEACQSRMEKLSEQTETIKTVLNLDHETSHPQWETHIADRIAAAIAENGLKRIAKTGFMPAVEGYEIESIIAHGGMGIVYLARQINADRKVALKMMLYGQQADVEEVQRFQIEAQAAAKLTHQFIVPVFDVGVSDGQHYFSMGFISGTSLKELLQNGLLPTREAAEMIRKISAAIAYAHEEGIVHRDLKPGNILVDHHGDPHVTDFGLAKQVNQNDQLTKTGQVIGTPSFMSPEQARGQVSEIGTLSDVYSIGALLYATLTGRPPFQSDNAVKTIMQVIEDPPVSPRVLNPEVSRDLETICLKCLEKNPASRYQSAEELKLELKRYLDGLPILARPVSAPVKLWRWCVRKPALAGMMVSVVVSLLIGTAVSTYFAILANQRAERADEGIRVALTSLETIIETVQRKLYQVPGASKIRRDLLKVVDSILKCTGFGFEQFVW
ncbi:serine/threonine protein kinase [Rubinisphaera italica]|uniref:non-specific serine/threonine protein kinase n=1 Tax=Rubinisphaera italica TaxID=2527969 RepID=A0A5C5XJD1_9PLAN|nr:serine/threonine-protein kinase [Rubinisphaera italica]TWT63297.1 Serine/threonine-protein kinase PrkC [Rubinisphaera italica]